jgi:hypothetical protein
MTCRMPFARWAMPSWLAVCAIAGSVLIASLAAHAEIYECVGSDGKLHFTGDPTQCAGARPHELKREIHLEDRSKARAARPPAASRARRARAGSASQERMWRRKQAEARAKLEAAELEWQRGREMVGACNRGSSWWGTDESGIRRKISCNTIKSEFAKVARTRDELRDYVAQGLAEECRRAGCLPGWLRE